MAQWAVVIPQERYQGERLFHHDLLELSEIDGRQRPAAGDEVLVVAGEAAPAVVALGRVFPGSGGQPDRDPDDADAQADADDQAGEAGAGPLVISYTHRAFDAPQPLGSLALDGALTRLDQATFRAVADRIGPPADRSTWLVSLDLPIEAETPAEAVRQFWTYVMELGPRELPAFVWPSGDELSMQAYVLGEEANLDPEEDDED